ncbi:MAG: hypothetical protein ABI690_18215 [Chloroflexota bacterium]
MTTQALQPPKHYAKLICHYMKTLPDKFADDPQDVQDALGLSDAEFKAGLDWCVEHKLITLDKPVAPAVATPAPVAATVSAPASPSPFINDGDEDETVGARESVFGSSSALSESWDNEDETVGNKKSVFETAEVAAVG